jgi:hypothetical protein
LDSVQIFELKAFSTKLKIFSVAILAGKAVNICNVYDVRFVLVSFVSGVIKC